MRFIIKQTGVGAERIGQLTGFVKSPTTIIETPTAALFTQAGSVVNLTAEVLAMVFPTPQLLWVPLSNSLHLENGLKAQNEGLAKFAGLPEHFTCVALQSVSEPVPFGHHELDKIPLWTKHGKKLITSDRYMDLIELYKPDMYVTIADGHTGLNYHFKRLSKAIERSQKSLNTCVERHKSSEVLNNTSLIGSIVGTGHMDLCGEFIEKLLTHKENLCGITLQGLTDGSDHSFTIKDEYFDIILKYNGRLLPKNLLRILEGCWSPTIILVAIDNGWDLFDGSYPVKLSNAGYALRLKFDIDTNDDTPFFLDLNDSKYKEDFNPILASCECLACKKHTRAYIRHLLNTREMLANVLLSIHNLYHFDQFFRHTRRHIAEKTFKQFKEHITQQCKAHKLVIPVPRKIPIAPMDVIIMESKKKQRLQTVAKVQSTVTEVQSTVAEVQSNIAEVQSTVAEVQATVVEGQPNIAEVQSTVAEVQSNVAEVQSTVAEVQSTVAKVQSTVAEMQLNVAEVPSTVAEVQSTVADSVEVASNT